MQCSLICCWPVDLSLRGKVAIVTGGNRGIGFQTALALVQKGMDVIIACRDKKRGEAAANMINIMSCIGKCQSMALDLCDFRSVRQFVSDFEALNLPLDILINNAAIMASPYVKTRDGFESQFQTNHLSHFLLTLLLLPKMSTKARIVNVSSIAHMGSSNLDSNKIMNLNESMYDPWDSYCDSKMANVLFTYELQKRLSNTKIVATTSHPGIIATGLWKYQPLLLPGASCSTCSFKLPAEGSKSVIYAATSKQSKSPPGYYVNWCCCFFPLVGTKLESYDSKLQKEVWEASEKAVGLSSTLQEVDIETEKPSILMQILGLFCM